MGWELEQSWPSARFTESRWRPREPEQSCLIFLDLLAFSLGGLVGFPLFSSFLGGFGWFLVDIIDFTHPLLPPIFFCFITDLLTDTTPCETLPSIHSSILLCLILISPLTHTSVSCFTTQHDPHDSNKFYTYDSLSVTPKRMCITFS